MKRQKPSIVRVLLAAAFLLLVTTFPAAAEGLDLKKIPKVAVYDTPPVADFEKATKLIAEEKPLDDFLLAYKFRAPKDFSRNLQPPPISHTGNEKILNASVPEILGRYVSEPKNLLRSRITVEAQRMTYEISAVSWFVNFIVSNGFTLNAITVYSPKMLDAVYVQVEDDVAYIVRTRILINGPRLLIVRYYLPQDNFAEEKITQTRVINSFGAIHPSKDGIEKRKEYGFLDLSYFNYPESWSLREKSILSIERMSVTLYQEGLDDDRSVLEGQMKIALTSTLLDTTLAKEVERFRKNFVVRNYKVGSLIENIVYTYDPSIKKGQAQIYRLIADDPVRMKAYELLVTIMQGDDYYYITSLITPARGQDYYQWARNMEAARIVNETMRRSNRNLKYDPNDPYFDFMKGQ